MKFIRRSITLLMFVLLSWFSVDAQNEDALEAYYFYSPDCPRCADVAPYIKELSKGIRMRGFVHGKGDAEPMPFEVRQAGRFTLWRYDVHTFPSLAIMKNGKMKQMLIGEQDVRDAGVLLRAFRNGAWSVSEVIEKKPQKEFRVIGWVVSKGEYFHNPQFYLTDRQQTLLIKPWLPIEAVKSPFRKTRSRLMSDVIGKPLFLEGTATKINNNLEFTVGKEMSFE